MSETTTSQESSQHPEMSQPTSLPVLPLREAVVLPQMVLPVLVGRARSRQLVQHLIENELDLVALSTLTSDTETPTSSDLHPTATVAKVVQLVSFPDGNYRMVVEGLGRVRLRDFEQSAPFMIADVDWLDDQVGDPVRTEALRRRVIEQFARLGRARTVPR